jgi:hypothetical protein
MRYITLKTEALAALEELYKNSTDNMVRKRSHCLPLFHQKHYLPKDQGYICSGNENLHKIMHADLLAIDDIMLFPVKKEDSSAFFNLINTLYEKVSLIITTNKSPTEWAETLDDEVLASALLDRLLYKCEVVKLSGYGNNLIM